MTAIRLSATSGTRNGMPPSGTYLYRGRKREGLPDLEAANKAIRDARAGQPGTWNNAPRLPHRDGWCVNGHEYTDANTTRRRDGGRRCMTCRRNSNTRRKAAAA